jgi:RNA polymerase sigma-70 factor, ECF subfamily
MLGQECLHDMSDVSNTTLLLERWRAGDHDAGNELFPLIYGELHRLAERALARHPGGRTLQPTALVHEAFLKLVAPAGRRYGSRVHFFGLAAKAMRSVVVDRARARAAEKRGGGLRRLTLTEDSLILDEQASHLMGLDDALERLKALDEQLARIVELRFFGQLTHEEIGVVLGVSSRTVERGWRTARAWLHDAIGLDGQGPARGPDAA